MSAVVVAWVDVSDGAGGVCSHALCWGPRAFVERVIASGSHAVPVAPLGGAVSPVEIGDIEHWRAELTAELAWRLGEPPHTVWRLVDGDRTMKAPRLHGVVPGHEIIRECPGLRALSVLVSEYLSACQRSDRPSIARELRLACVRELVRVISEAP